MLLSEILSGVEYVCDNFKDVDIRDITYNSKNAGKDNCFVCLVGTLVDGHKFAAGAYEQGCRCIFTERKLELPTDCIQIITENTRRTLAMISVNFFEHPADKMKIIGITGTKGKTTTAHLVKTLIESTGEKCGIIGTVGASYGDVTLETANTTPESYELQKLFRLMLNDGCKYCVIEASSLGLKMHRTDGIYFETGVFTNLSPDHIGTIEHPTFEDYMQSKALLFKSSKNAAVNVDDPAYEDMLKGSGCNVITYGLGEADITASDVKLLRSKDILGISFKCRDCDGEFDVKAPIPGYFNVYNVLAAFAVCRTLGIDIRKSSEALKGFKVSGRVEVVHVSDDFDVIIDFAHNGLSMHSILGTLNGYPHNRLIALYGAIGERTQHRREELGTVAGKECDLSILTTEDPGFEDPMKICEEIAGFVKKVGGKYMIILKRQDAIRYALSNMQKGDILVIAGKGGEKYMKIRGEHVPYSDLEEVQKFIKSQSV